MNNYKVYHRTKATKSPSSSTRVYTRKATNNLSNIIFFSLIAVLSIGLYYVLLVSDYFLIKNVDVVGAVKYVNSSDLTTLTQSNLKDTRIFLLDENKLEKTLLNNFKGAKSINIKKDLPDKILLEVHERQPLAVLSNKEAYLIDDSGYVLGLVDIDAANLPVIKYEDDLIIGEFINAKMIPLYLELVNSLDSKEVSVSSISLNDQNAKIFLGGSGEAYIDLNKNIATSVALLDDLLTQVGIEGKRVKKVDLRYDKVVVSFE